MRSLTNANAAISRPPSHPADLLDVIAPVATPTKRPCRAPHCNDHDLSNSRETAGKYARFGPSVARLSLRAPHSARPTHSLSVPPSPSPHSNSQVGVNDNLHQLKPVALLVPPTAKLEESRICKIRPVSVAKPHRAKRPTRLHRFKSNPSTTGFRVCKHKRSATAMSSTSRANLTSLQSQVCSPSAVQTTRTRTANGQTHLGLGPRRRQVQRVRICKLRIVGDACVLVRENSLVNAGADPSAKQQGPAGETKNASRLENGEVLTSSSSVLDTDQSNAPMRENLQGLGRRPKARRSANQQVLLASLAKALRLSRRTRG
uniref:Uncharacterized protein n=1 Tax=Mycena chlorophos TaxID=658473 RepID=A0ABQ0L2Q1_MYCCL|nr:predicted protein [Mycena chlorophos]